MCLTRVLPSKSPRLCLTVWMSEAQTRSPVPSPAQIRARASLKLHAQNGGDLPSDIAAILLRDPEVLRHIGRLRHCVEWAKSIKVLQGPHFFSFLLTSARPYSLLSSKEHTARTEAFYLFDRKATLLANQYNQSWQHSGGKLESL